MYVEVRKKNAKYYVILRGEDLYRHEDSKGKQFAHFVSTNRDEVSNVAKQFAKQNKCLIRWTSGGIETPELPSPPDFPHAEG